MHGVGADGVGVKFPIFAVNCRKNDVCPCPLGEAEKSEEKGEKCVKIFGEDLLYFFGDFSVFKRAQPRVGD